MNGGKVVYIGEHTPWPSYIAVTRDKGYPESRRYYQRDKCKNVCNSISEFTCSACGFSCDLTSWISLFDGDDGRHRHHHHGVPNFCPNCGLEVE